MNEDQEIMNVHKMWKARIHWASSEKQKVKIVTIDHLGSNKWEKKWKKNNLLVEEFERLD